MKRYRALLVGALLALVLVVEVAMVTPAISAVRAGDPDQPQESSVVNPFQVDNYCSYCRASGGAISIFCAICRMQQAWDGLGDWW